MPCIIFEYNLNGISSCSLLSDARPTNNSKLHDFFLLGVSLSVFDASVRGGFAGGVGRVVVQINRATAQSGDINLVMYDCYRRWRYCRIWNMLPVLFFRPPFPPSCTIHLTLCRVLFIFLFVSLSFSTLPFFPSLSIISFSQFFLQPFFPISPSLNCSFFCRSLQRYAIPWLFLCRSLALLRNPDSIRYLSSNRKFNRATAAKHFK